MSHINAAHFVLFSPNALCPVHTKQTGGMPNFDWSYTEQGLLVSGPRGGMVRSISGDNWNHGRDSQGMRELPRASHWSIVTQSGCHWSLHDTHSSQFFLSGQNI